MRYLGLYQSRLSNRRWPFLIAAAIWALIALLLNLPWEIAQCPFYHVAPSVRGARLAYCVFHCTTGDAIIATTIFLLTGLAPSARDWPSTRLRSEAAIVLLMGVGYTAFSEWRNVYELSAWSYARAMPRVFGIVAPRYRNGFSYPFFTLFAYRRISARRRRARG